MIKIEKPSDITSSGRTGKTRKSQGSTPTDAFSQLMQALGSPAEINEQATIDSIQDVSSIGSIDAILTAQSVSDELIRRRRQIKQAHLTLDTLEMLRNALLLGAVPAYLLNSIEQRMNVMKQDVADPDLRSIIEEIELRAAVELAKFRMQR